METTTKHPTLSSRVIGTSPVSWRKLQFLQSDNFKQLSETRRQKLKRSIIENQFSQPFYVWQDGENIYCLDGKHRTMMLTELIEEGIPVPDELPATFIRCNNKKEAAKLVLVYSSIYANVTNDGLTDFMDVFNISMDEIRFDIELSEFDMYGFAALTTGEDSKDIADIAHVSLKDRYIVPPFSILDTRQGYWQERKKKWHQLGIASQETREDVELISRSGQSGAVYNLRNKMRVLLQRDPTWDEILAEAEKRGMHIYSGASIFDPVLCEVLYRWFCPATAVCGDPFAGGSVRGIVASLLGLDYVGTDLRPEQVAANESQAIALKDMPQLSGTQRGYVKWYSGDALDIETILPDNTLFDFLFSCPPYHDLEQYSDDSRDLSNMNYDEFLINYREIVKRWAKRLKDNRFACFVVSEIRDSKGYYKNFVRDTINAFEDAGCRYYNELILVNVAGSLPVRVHKQFSSSRKAGRTHQNVLVFYKGDPAAIKLEFPEIKAEEIHVDSLDNNEYQPNIALTINE